MQTRVCAGDCLQSNPAHDSARQHRQVLSGLKKAEPQGVEDVPAVSHLPCMLDVPVHKRVVHRRGRTRRQRPAAREPPARQQRRPLEQAAQLRRPGGRLSPAHQTPSSPLLQRSQQCLGAVNIPATFNGDPGALPCHGEQTGGQT